MYNPSQPTWYTPGTSNMQQGFLAAPTSGAKFEEMNGGGGRGICASWSSGRKICVFLTVFIVFTIAIVILALIPVYKDAISANSGNNKLNETALFEKFLPTTIVIATTTTTTTIATTTTSVESSTKKLAAADQEETAADENTVGVDLDKVASNEAEAAIEATNTELAVEGDAEQLSEDDAATVSADEEEHRHHEHDSPLKDEHHHAHGGDKKLEKDNEKKDKDLHGSGKKKHLKKEHPTLKEKGHLDFDVENAHDPNVEEPHHLKEHHDHDGSGKKAHLKEKHDHLKDHDEQDDANAQKLTAANADVRQAAANVLELQLKAKQQIP